MKIGIYHPFGNLPDNYSLSHIVKEQMLMLIENEHECHFITAQWFKGSGVPEGVTVHNILTNENHIKIKKDVETILEAEDYDAIFTHDIVYLSTFEQHAKAIKLFIRDFPRIKWLHWVHSAPVVAEKRLGMNNSLYIGMNYTDVQRMAEQFQIPQAMVRVVYNPVSPDMFYGGWHEFTKWLVKDYDLLDCDVLMTYPLDTGRFEGKGGDKIIKLVEGFRKRDINAKVVFINAAANNRKRRELIEKWVEGKEDYVIFTSRENPSYEIFAPRRVVRELMQISDVFPLLSMSEGCSLTMIEAGLTGQLIILNEDFPPLKEFGETSLVHYMKVSSTRQSTQYNPNIEGYMFDQAGIIWDKLNGSPIGFKRKMLKKFHRGYIWKNQLEPLLR